jgi:drug/metabolite transporter (DMT)-like permease
MRLGETNVAFSFYGYIAALFIGGALYALRGAPPLALADIGYLMLSGTLAGISSICLMTAYHRTPVALVAPFQYTQIIWGAIAGYLIWRHVPDANLLMGALIVAGSGMFVIYREFKARAAN